MNAQQIKDFFDEVKKRDNELKTKYYETFHNDRADQLSNSNTLGD